MRLLMCTFFILLCFTNTAYPVFIDGKEWRQVADTVGHSYNDYDAIFDTTSGECDVGGCLLGGVIDLSGLTWASSAEVDSMLATITLRNLPGPPLTGSYNMVDDPLIPLVFGFFSPTFEDLTPPTTFRRIRGWTRDCTFSTPDCPDPVTIGHRILVTDIITREGGRARLDSVQIQRISATSRAGPVGAWLYETASVPTPSSLALFALGLAGLGFVRRKKA